MDLSERPVTAGLSSSSISIKSCSGATSHSDWIRVAISYICCLSLWFVSGFVALWASHTQIYCFVCLEALTHLEQMPETNNSPNFKTYWSLWHLTQTFLLSEKKTIIHCQYVHSWKSESWISSPKRKLSCGWRHIKKRKCAGMSDSPIDILKYCESFIGSTHLKIMISFILFKYVSKRFFNN